jgi:hypothetical protein
VAVTVRHGDRLCEESVRVNKVADAIGPHVAQVLRQQAESPLLNPRERSAR